jgi:cellulose synthase/poly-beta-1,6-N-acetylglucosamine synthase-like glycosyltransferase
MTKDGKINLLSKLDPLVHPRTEAAKVLNLPQHILLWMLAAGLVALCLWDCFLFIVVVNLILCSLYFCVMLLKCGLMFLAEWRDPRVRIASQDVDALRKSALPVYTVMVPLYHEAGVAVSLMRAIDALEYPGEMLDVKLLLEADDTETIAAVQKAMLEAKTKPEIVLAPSAGPRTKPRACNEGLARARGEFTVVYDAEDRPDPDQLLKAVAAFRKLENRIACLQCALDFYNPQRNWLTRQFTVEYAAWFDLFLPGLHVADLPIPLGGTSNHFRTATLRAVGGWDPYNLTEDCELGMRLHATGNRTAILASTTWEEASSEWGVWMRQRSRWSKGYAQTFLALTRRPFRLARQLGLRGLAGFLLVVGGFTLIQLVNPVYWVVGGLYLAIRWQMLYAGDRMSEFFFTVSIALVFANVLFILANLAAARRRGGGRLYLAALMSPAYWVMASLATWRGVLQLLTKPFYWEKTPHGPTSRLET